MPILPKSKPKFIQQHHNLPTLSKFHHQHCPNCTMIRIKKTTLQECSKANIFKHDQSHNDPKFQNNQMTISHHETFNETCNNIFPSKETKEKKTHLGVYMIIWSMGPRILKKPILIIPIKCWIIFLTMKSKQRGSLGGRSHLDAKKNGFRKRVSLKMGV